MQAKPKPTIDDELNFQYSVQPARWNSLVIKNIFLQLDQIAELLAHELLTAQRVSIKTQGKVTKVLTLITNMFNCCDFQILKKIYLLLIRSKKNAKKVFFSYIQNLLWDNLFRRRMICFNYSHKAGCGVEIFCRLEQNVRRCKLQKKKKKYSIYKSV